MKCNEMGMRINAASLQQATLGSETVVVLSSRPYKEAEVINYHPFTTNRLMESCPRQGAIEAQS